MEDGRFGDLIIGIPPPCGEGRPSEAEAGVEVHAFRARGYPPPQPFPARGEGEESHFKNT
jgi:hypothetical protein